MPDLVSSTVIVSALTSAAVALGVDWTVKPRLEARKERLLAAHRARSTVLRCLTIILVAAAKLGTETPGTLTADARKMWLAELDAAKETIAATSRDLEQAVLDAGIPFERILVPLTRFANQSRGLVLGDRRNHEKAELILASGAPLLEAWRAAMRPLFGIRAVRGGSKLVEAVAALDRAVAAGQSDP
ncbi:MULTISPECIES: hypothetical protein [unclassified Kribbella]|uniref:hypothetical protein n=1 Tax=unclassified Kribbella TaxID=2644121 RepID=UPI0033CAA171